MIMMEKLNNENHNAFNSLKYCLASSDAVRIKVCSKAHLSLNSAQQLHSQMVGCNDAQ